MIKIATNIKYGFLFFVLVSYVYSLSPIVDFHKEIHVHDHNHHDHHEVLHCVKSDENKIKYDCSHKNHLENNKENCFLCDYKVVCEYDLFNIIEKSYDRLNLEINNVIPEKDKYGLLFSISNKSPPLLV